MPLKRVGFFRQLPYGRPTGPDLEAAVRPTASVEEPQVLAWLEGAPVLLATPGLARDQLDPNRPPIGPPHIRTDGVHCWPSDLAWYVRRYHALLPEAFVAHVVAAGNTRPQVDLQSLSLAGSEDMGVGP